MPSRGHSTKAIACVESYVREHGGEITVPVITQHFTPGAGWKRHGWRKRISLSYARRLKREGVTSVGLEIAPGRVAAFRIAELLGSREIA
jgi:hypothetical protein